jgi:hypothetical protein
LINQFINISTNIPEKAKFFSKIVTIETLVNNYNAIVRNRSVRFKVFDPEDDPVWLKHAAEINTTDIIDVLTALYSFVTYIHLAPQ